MKFYSYIIASALLLGSCTAKKTITESPISTTKPIKNNSAFFCEINKSQDFQSLKINSKIDARTGNFIPTLDAVIYIENGQKIWMNLVAVILQAARGVATPQGIKGYYKLDKKYIDSDFSYLNKLLNVNFINYEALQNLILGKSFINIDEKDFVLTQNAQGYNLKSNQATKITANGKTIAYNINLDYDNNYQLSKVFLSDQASENTLEITYSNRENIGNLSLPKSVKIIIKADKTDEILLENTKFDFSTMDTPYSVPANYTKTDIR